jgi:hypothetical protein
VLGFTAIGTLVLLLMGLLSYVFVVRGLSHTHEVDTIDASGLSVGALLDLRPGKFISAGIDSTGVASWNNIFIGDSTLIERVYDTRFDDVIWGNALDNHIYWSAGNDVIDGQAGTDTVVVNAKRSQFDLAYSDYAQQFVLSDLQGQLGSVSLSNIDKVISRTAPAGAPTVSKRLDVKIIEIFSYPVSKRISDEPLPDEVVEQLLIEVDQLFAKAKSKNKTLGQ